VLGVGRLLFVHRALARVLDRKCRRDDEDLAHTAVALGLQHHPAQPRVDRQLGEPAALIGQAALGARVEGTQFLQQRHAVVDTAPVRWLHEPERLIAPRSRRPSEG
jgi:hypothetical protein